MKLLVKLGGALVDDPTLRASIAEQVSALVREGHQVFIVHGGGKQLTRFLEKQGVKSRFLNGLRVTGEEEMDAVLQVLAGSVNRRLVAALARAGVRAVGISGVDASMVVATRMSEELGWVGKVAHADPTLANLLSGGGFVPVISCVAGDGAGECLNINADQMAAACASAFAADRVVLLTDVAGVMDAEGLVLPRLNIAESDALIASGVARGGMQAKLEAVALALRAGVDSVLIAPGAAPGILTRATDGAAEGTMVTA